MFDQSTGFRHLYMLTPSGSGFDATPITKGDNWLVDDNFLVVDEVRVGDTIIMFLTNTVI